MINLEWVLVLVAVSLWFVCGSIIASGLVSSIDKDKMETGDIIIKALCITFPIIFIVLAFLMEA